MDSIIAKAIKALTVCKRLDSKIWGYKPGKLLWMYTTIDRPIVAIATVEKQLSKQREEEQRLACVCITEAMYTCPTVALDMILDLTPLHVVVEMTEKDVNEP